MHVIGAGAVGTVLTASLSRARQQPRLIVRDVDLQRMAAVETLRVERVSAGGMLDYPKPAISVDYQFAEGDIVLICVKHRDLEDICARLAQCPVADLVLVPCLNGVGVATRLRRQFPQWTIAPMTIMFNAQLLEPLHARITTKPEVLLSTDEPSLLQRFTGSGLVVRRAEDEAVAWGKLLINLANALCALTHTTFKDLLSDPDMRRCFVMVLDEATGIMQAAGVRFDLPIALPYRAYRALIQHGGPVPWWFARLKNGLTDGAYPSMVADVEDGKETEVEQLNGQIVDMARECGQSAPVNARIVEMVSALHGQPQEYFLAPRALRDRLEDATH
ncbi:MAG: ketopantoate reductase C-terminal domain-containing protein [Oceanococcaceae bacterium]